MDPNKLPRVALIDTGVLTRAIGDLAPDADTSACRGFYDAMLDNARLILIAAPSIAEVIRKDGKRTVPRTSGIEVVAFDQVAAELLGRRFPMAVLKELVRAGTTMTYFKYDAMIVACAMRYSAECIVALDDDFATLGAHVGMPVYHPSHFLGR
jgi:predicted nucleic acid-binding protein